MMSLLYRDTSTVVRNCIQSAADLAATARIRNGWMKFREILLFLTWR